MRDEASQDPPWSFHSPLGALHCDVLHGQVDVARPQLGLHQIKLRGSALAGSICGVERHNSSSSHFAAWPAGLADAYVRGRDLIATYQPAVGWPFAPQIYWRSEPQEPSPDTLGGLSLLVSVSTHLLDTRPRISVVSCLNAEEVLHFTASTEGVLREQYVTDRSELALPASSGACCLLRRLRGGQISYAEIMPGSDFLQLFVQHSDDGRCLARWELFAEFLEKGVIRRTQMQAIFLPRAADLQLANACCEMISARPLPLTT